MFQSFKVKSKSKSNHRNNGNYPTLATTARVGTRLGFSRLRKNSNR